MPDAARGGLSGFRGDRGGRFGGCMGRVCDGVVHDVFFFARLRLFFSARLTLFFLARLKRDYWAGFGSSGFVGFGRGRFLWLASVRGKRGLTCGDGGFGSRNHGCVRQVRWRLEHLGDACEDTNVAAREGRLGAEAPFSRSVADEVVSHRKRPTLARDLRKRYSQKYVSSVYYLSKKSLPP